MPLLHSLQRCRELSAEDRSLFLRAYLDLIWVNLVLRLYGFQRLIARLDRRNALAEDLVTIDDLRRARHYARWVESAAQRHLAPAHCLQRSLVLHRWLRHEGLPSRLRIGVARDGSALKAHAWVELGGRVINDRAAAVMTFTPLASANSRGIRWK